ncbi:MAG TPA: hypothetical protein VFO00_11115 [Vitreimonas sp.]|nr:hypothetical protein [Vitreimonas sp.]
MKLVTKGLFAGLVLVLAACGQNNEKTAGTPPAPPVPEAYSWGAVAPSTAQAGPPAAINLSGGYAYAILPQTAVAAGDTVNARVTLQGPASRWVRVVLGRHCDATTGDESTPSNVELNGQAQTVEVSHTFQQAYSCVRLSLVSMDGQALPVTVSELTVTKTAAAGGDIRD